MGLPYAIPGIAPAVSMGPSAVSGDLRRVARGSRGRLSFAGVDRGGDRNVHVCASFRAREGMNLLGNASLSLAEPFLGDGSSPER
jgi:hypothetical protein